MGGLLMADWNALLDALHDVEEDAAPSRATSIRLPAPVHRAATLAIDLGMDESFTAATTRALLDRIHAFVRDQSLAEHFSAYPADRPRLADIGLRRVSGTDHPAAGHPDLVEEVSSWVERRHPEWPTSGSVDAIVDDVLDRVEMLTVGIGARSKLAT
jgi:hypothetical protein